jgi:hypothetical protein
MKDTFDNLQKLIRRGGCYAALETTIGPIRPEELATVSDWLRAIDRCLICRKTPEVPVVLTEPPEELGLPARSVVAYSLCEDCLCMPLGDSFVDAILLDLSQDTAPRQ